jgi:hypothetical protein
MRREFNYSPAEAWERQAPDAMKKMSTKVIDSMWGQQGSLWVEVRDDGTDWTKAGHQLCLRLRGIGKPESKGVIFTFWRNGTTAEKFYCDYW